MKKIWYMGGGVVALVVAGVAWYALSPLFVSIRVEESAPSQEKVSETMSAPVLGTAGHPASGTARIVEADGLQYVRYENFKTINGPDLYVYLSKDLSATDFVDLGRLRATEGNVNYEIPSGVNLEEYPYVLTWCKQFGVLFNSAKLGT